MLRIWATEEIRALPSRQLYLYRPYLISGTSGICYYRGLTLAPNIAAVSSGVCYNINKFESRASSLPAGSRRWSHRFRAVGQSQSPRGRTRLGSKSTLRGRYEDHEWKKCILGHGSSMGHRRMQQKPSDISSACQQHDICGRQQRSGP